MNEVTTTRQMFHSPEIHAVDTSMVGGKKIK